MPAPTPPHRDQTPLPAARRRLAVAGGVLLGGLFLWQYAVRLLLPVYGAGAGSDFAAPYYPAARLLLAGGDPYSVAPAPFMQPATFLLLIAPLTALPVETARALWLGIETLLLGGGIAATLAAWNYQGRGGRALPTALVYLSPNIVYGLLLGQSVVVLFALEAAGLWALRRGRPGWAGLLLGGLVLKPHLLAVVVPLLLSAPRRAWAGAALSAGALLLAPDLLGRPLLVPFLRRVLAIVQAERYNKLNPADLFVNLAGGGPGLHALGWLVLAGGAAVYAGLLWRVWRARPRGAAPWQPTPLILAAMAAAFLWLPYSLAYDLILVAGLYLWRFAADGYRLTRPLVWNLAALWLLPILTLALHARGVATTLNPLLILGLLGLLLRPRAAQPAPVGPGAARI